MGFGRTRRDNPNVLATPGLYNYEQTAHLTHADRDKSLLTRVGFLIRDRDGVRIVKNRNRFGHPHPVFAKVDPGFAFFVPRTRA